MALTGRRLAVFAAPGAMQLKEPSLKLPGAFLPLAMSAIGLAMILIHLTRFGIVHQEDEGTPARLFQLLMAAQLPIMLFFAARWLPVAPRQALAILALQIAAATVPVLLILYLES